MLAKKRVLLLLFHLLLNLMCQLNIGHVNFLRQKYGDHSLCGFKKRTSFWCLELQKLVP